MAANPLLTASGQLRIPLLPSPFGPPAVDRDVLPSTVAPADSRQFCAPSQFGTSVLPTANMPSVLSNRVYSGWGILPPESIKTVARRNEMIQRHHHTARTEMEMYAIYQQQRMEKTHPKGLAGLGTPFPYGPLVPASPAAYHSRSRFSASDLHFHRSVLRSLQGGPVLAAAGPHFVESWGQKCRRLRKGAGGQRGLDGDPESSRSPAREKTLGQTRAVPSEEDPCAEMEERDGRRSSEPEERAAAALSSTCAGLTPTWGKPRGPHAASLEAKAWYGGEKPPPAQAFAACGEDRVSPAAGLAPSPPGPRVPAATGDSLALDEDIQKWSVDDVHRFIGGLPGCSDYAQVFKDHAIDGETLPLLTEEHLRGTMGLKLGPALKIQSQVSQHVGSRCYRKNLSLSACPRQALAGPADTTPLADFHAWSDPQGIPCSQEMGTPGGAGPDSLGN
ncbi:sterile alpha motif domain-containing protein 7 [Carlito syrichta]|uniref:Sterile alpha motif domain-containing protein 7 n=1 Tax=Carlito syrichta TaxID=1868482 RepID=A0A1U7TAI3_CARSF|nr:sterile alpha motif domain-containing protein 7 [Carlito syrichta]